MNHNHWINRIRRFSLLLALVTFTSLNGCAGKGDIKGKVTYDGKTVVYGTVMVIDSEGVPHPGVIGPDGNYTVRGVTTGKAKLAVDSPNPQLQYEKVAAVWAGGRQGSTGKPGTDNSAKVPKPDPELVKKWFEIPIKNLNDPDKSGLTLEIKSGENPHDIPLK